MPKAGAATLEYDANTRQCTARGDWTLEWAAGLATHVDAMRGQARAPGLVDASGVGRLDTAGAELLLDLAGGGAINGLGRPQQVLLDAVAHARAVAQPAAKARPNAIVATMARTGIAAERFWRNTIALTGFIGLVLSRVVAVLPRPHRWRVTSLVASVEETGLDAVPIVVLLSFLVGAVVAFLGATVLKDFGASIFTVELVGYSFLREFGVLLTAILVAGRSGSAFTAQIGSMKVREEIDAIRALGLDPVDVLVVPRIIALLVALPILTLLAMLAGIVGGALVCVAALDISPAMFITRLHETASVRHFWVGMSKAPVFAFLIGAIGCLEGFKVGGSAASVGRHTTSSVVQAIFVVILVDALAAIFFMELGL